MSRRGRKSKRKTRSQRPRKEQSPAVTIDTVEDTTGGTGEGVDLAQPRLRSKIKDVEDYIKGNAFTDEQAAGMLKKMGAIVANDKTGRYAIGAYRVILARAKLAHDIDRGLQQRPTINIDARSDSGGANVFAIAADLGLSIDIDRDGETTRDRDIVADVIEGSARRAQPENE